MIIIQEVVSGCLQTRTTSCITRKNITPFEFTKRGDTKYRGEAQNGFEYNKQYLGACRQGQLLVLHEKIINPLSIRKGKR